MSDRTGIEWCDATLNPLVGCTAISEACEHCWALRTAARLAFNPAFGEAGNPYRSTVTREGIEPWQWTGQIAFFPERLDQPRHWRKPRRIFVGGMTDLFHPHVMPSQIGMIWDTMAKCQWHIFQLLTKRPTPALCWFNANHLPPLPNLWFGVTAENQARADERIPTLLQIPAAVRFVSVEPMLAPVNLVSYVEQSEPLGSALDLVIIGCESGPGRRHTDIAWIRDLVRQCQEAGVPVFVKQIEVPRMDCAELRATCQRAREPIDSQHWEDAIERFGSRISHDPAEWPADLRIREMPDA